MPLLLFSARGRGCEIRLIPFVPCARINLIKMPFSVLSSCEFIETLLLCTCRRTRQFVRNIGYGVCLWEGTIPVGCEHMDVKVHLLLQLVGSALHPVPGTDRGAGCGLTECRTTDMRPKVPRHHPSLADFQPLAPRPRALSFIFCRLTFVDGLSV